ncbi:Probable RNA-directed DNA polymerase from transposon X-element [Eumeta japonica]|uniref:Probable RNA-directed DNA polymerase from transposon X-element n=1 Tax=Eumeta variegata TaxID=151549 RepID=A0A4C1YLK7_EUMVA|nr:Probable RNA-directed DNA polymerase from transposon X-element [Eumeta japonica]
MGPPHGGSPNPTLKITDWKKVSTALEKIDTPSLNSIPDNISTTDEIDCHSYRPISLLSGLAKHFERILKSCLSDHLLGKGLIIDEQFGFHPVHSCPQQVLRLVEYISEGFKSKQKTVAVFFDVAKTFDKDATDAHWFVRNSILHWDLELPTIAKFMKDVFKRFFDIAGSHSDALLRSAVNYEPPHRHHFIRRPRNVLTDPPDALTAAVDSLMEVNDTHD